MTGSARSVYGDVGSADPPALAIVSAAETAVAGRVGNIPLYALLRCPVLNTLRAKRVLVTARGRVGHATDTLVVNRTANGACGARKAFGVPSPTGNPGAVVATFKERFGITFLCLEPPAGAVDALLALVAGKPRHIAFVAALP